MRKACIELMNGKKIYLNLFEDYAPIAIANFLHLAKIKFYDGLIFHRIIPGFMSQAGAYFITEDTLNERRCPWSIPGEFVENGFEDNVLSHTCGVISMARTNDPNSAGSQFFICDENAEFLNGKYAAFGIVADTESLNIVKELNHILTFKLSEELSDFPKAELQDITIKTIYEIEG